MPTLEENKQWWDRGYHWRTAGDKWSRPWGNADMQWHAALLPRIRPFVPAETILEIAPGFGRWTHYLKGLCTKLIVVDLSAQCIEACQERFSREHHIEYHVNDGRSLEMIPDGTIDFVFTYDSLVHAEEDVIAAYLTQLSKKLKPSGVGFIHHSNAGRYARYFRLMRQLKRVRPLKFFLRLLRVPVRDHMRALTMTAEKFHALAGAAGLRCISQEIINWRSPLLLDCHSVITREDSPWPRLDRTLINRYFMGETRSVAVMAELYTGLTKDQA